MRVPVKPTASPINFEPAGIKRFSPVTESYTFCRTTEIIGVLILSLTIVVNSVAGITVPACNTSLAFTT